MRSKDTSARGYAVTLDNLVYRLKISGVLDHVEKIYQNETGSALVIVVRANRWFAECITVNRISRTNYHINAGSVHYRTRTSHQAVAKVKGLLREIKFDIQKEGIKKW